MKKDFIEKKLRFLLLFWFLINTFDLIYPPLWILENQDPRETEKNSSKVKRNLSVYLSKHCFLCIFVCFFTNWLPIMNPKNDEHTPIVRGIQTKYVIWERVKIGGF